MSNPDRPNRPDSKLRELVERFKLLAGVISLGVATAILVLSNRRRTGSQITDPSVGVIFIALIGALSFFLTSYRVRDGSVRSEQASRERILTG